MIITNQGDVTHAVLAAMENTENPRLREIMLSLVTHLHAFIRDVRLSEAEFQQATALIAELGQQTTETHNEVVLMAGSLGVSSLVCLLNNGNHGQTETTANLLGPFWRMHSPRTENGGSLLRSPTSGPPLFVNAKVIDSAGRSIAGAEVDVWHSSPVGLYENQDPDQAEMNLRGKFTTDEEGRFWFSTVKPAGYPIPVTGVVGQLLHAQRRQEYRPAHLHVLIYRPGYKTLVSQVYVNDDPRLEIDPQLGVTRALIGNYIRHTDPSPSPKVEGEWYSLDYSFKLEEGEARLPRPPIR